jgi:uncharacterized membrane protein
MSGILYPGGPHGLWVFLLNTIVLGGAAAWTTGRAIAKAWQRPVFVPVAMLALAAAVRFLHYSLFAESFFSPHYYVVDYAVLAAAAGLGFRHMRARQMVQQYGWLHVSASFFGWREKTPMDTNPNSMG